MDCAHAYSSRRRAAAPAAALAAVAWLGGCASEDASSRDPWHLDSWSHRQRPEDPRTFPVTSPVAIDVESLGGDVIVDVDESLTEATVTITREATHGFGRADEAKASLDRSSSTAELVPSETGPVLRIRTVTADPEPHFQRTHIQIELPHADGLRVRTQRGRVWATNVEGVVDVQTTEGDVRIMTNLPMRRPVTIVNRGADIDYRVRGDSSGAIDARTVRGQVQQRVRFGRLIVHGASGDSLLATLNGGENPVVLRNVDGDIRIAVVDDPTEVGAHILQP